MVYFRKFILSMKPPFIQYLFQYLPTSIVLHLYRINPTDHAPRITLSRRHIVTAGDLELYILLIKPPSI